MKYLSRGAFLLYLSMNSISSAFSQEAVPLTFGKVAAKDFTLSATNLIDSNTNAVVIADVGGINFIGNKDNNWVSYVFKQNMRIKILKRQALDLATVQVLLRGNGKYADRIDSLQASTYNLENGQVVETKLNLQDVYRDTLNRGTVAVKFSLPAVKEGSIIEYTYKTITHRFRHLPYWNFQHYYYPCLYNKYEVAIPNMLGYLTLLHGRDSFAINKLEKTKERYVMSTVDVKAEVTKHTWVMKNIPPFKTEPFLKHPYNYMDAIEFYLLQTYNGDEVSGNTNWSAINKELLEDEDFGQPISLDGSTSLVNTVERVITPHAGYMQSAREIYAYIRDNFTCVPSDYTYITDALYNINKKKKGTATDLNMLLVAMLRQKSINASPVLLSTTEYGTNPADYPVLEKMNYVICMMKMGGETIYLDASRPMLGFGKLPLDCYNGHGRVISDHDSASVFFNPNDIKEQEAATVFIVNDDKEKGKMSGTVEIVPGYLGSYNVRTAVKRNGEKNFFKDMLDGYGPDVKIENKGIDSLGKLEEPVKIHYDLSFKMDQDIAYFTPIVSSPFRENPLKSASRSYPVEMNYPLDEFYVFSMEIPEGYIVDELPKSVKVFYNSNEGFFEYLIQKGESNLQLRVHIKLNKADFSADDYNSLRDFFAYVVKKQGEPFVFKKKK